MNMFKKKQKNEAGPNNWKKTTGSFIRKPAKGWIHPDHLIETSAVNYETQVSFSIYFARKSSSHNFLLGS